MLYARIIKMRFLENTRVHHENVIRIITFM